MDLNVYCKNYKNNCEFQKQKHCDSDPRRETNLADEIQNADKRVKNIRN